MDMKTSLLVLFLVSLLFSCKKEINNQVEDRIMNGVDVNLATTTLNSFRTKGITGYPPVGKVAWNDTLSNAAYNFAKAKAEDINTPSNYYLLSNGESILIFPDLLNYSRGANFALYYGFPADAEVKTVLSAGFESTDQTILFGLMLSFAKEFGMGQFGGKWYLIIAG